MATTDATVKAQLEGLFKEVYSDKLENLIPDVGVLTKSVPFREAEKLGEAFNQPVIVSDEQGATYAGADEDAFTLEAPEAMTTKNARVKGSQILMRAAIGYKAAASAVRGGPKAFVNATELVIRRLMESITKRVEAMHLYGGSGLGVATDSTNISATETELDIDPLTWAPGLWVGSQCAKLEVYTEPAGTLIAEVQVGRVSDLRGAKLRVTGLAGAITALDAVFPSSQTLYFKGARGKEALGLDAIITTSGTLFEIDNSAFDLWKGQEFSASSAELNFSKITDAVVDARNYGLEEDVVCLCSPRTWQDLNDNEAALRQYDASFQDEAKKGSRSIVYQGQAGRIMVKAHPMVKEGEAFIYPTRRLKRVGAFDISMRTPGHGSEMFRHLEDQAAFELRAYTDQALFSDRPSHLVKITDIVNS